MDVRARTKLTLVTDKLPSHMLEQTRVQAGDWNAAQRASKEFIECLPEEAFVPANSMLMQDRRLSDQWTSMLMQFKRAKCREYLGPLIRGVHAGPKVLTPEFVQSLAVANQKDRVRREPYFVKIAAAYNYIRQLEWALDNKEQDQKDKAYALCAKS